MVSVEHLIQLWCLTKMVNAISELTISLKRNVDEHDFIILSYQWSSTQVNSKFHHHHCLSPILHGVYSFTWITAYFQGVSMVLDNSALQTFISIARNIETMSKTFLCYALYLSLNRTLLQKRWARFIFSYWISTCSFLYAPCGWTMRYDSQLTSSG